MTTTPGPLVGRASPLTPLGWDLLHAGLRLPSPSMWFWTPEEQPGAGLQDTPSKLLLRAPFCPCQPRLRSSGFPDGWLPGAAAGNQTRNLPQTALGSARTSARHGPRSRTSCPAPFQGETATPSSFPPPSPALVLAAYATGLPFASPGVRGRPPPVAWPVPVTESGQLASPSGQLSRLCQP